MRTQRGQNMMIYLIVEFTLNTANIVCKICWTLFGNKKENKIQMLESTLIRMCHSELEFKHICSTFTYAVWLNYIHIFYFILETFLHLNRFCISFVNERFFHVCQTFLFDAFVTIVNVECIRKCKNRFIHSR